MLTISIGNAVWYFVMLGTAAATVILYFVFRNRPEREIRRLLLTASLLVTVMFFILRLMLFHDASFIETFGTDWKTKVAHLLPFHLCYITPPLIIAGLLANRKRLLAFCFYIGPIGAILTIAFPDGFYLDKPLLTPSVLLFYLMHAMLVVLCFHTGFYGLFPIGWKTGLIAVVYMVIIGTVMHGINVAGQAAGFQYMNYFYTMHSGGSGLLETFHTWNPRPYFYVFGPCTMIGLVWTSFVTACYQVIVRIRRLKR